MLSSKVVLVAGACGLLGQQIVREIVEQNGCVLATDIDAEKSKKIYFNLYLQNKFTLHQWISLMLIPIDKAIAIGSDYFGLLDACVNSAYPRSQKWGKPFEELEIEYIQENLKLQLGGAIILSQRLMKQFVLQEHGNFIHLSSIQGSCSTKI